MPGSRKKVWGWKKDWRERVLSGDFTWVSGSSRLKVTVFTGFIP